MGRGILMGLVLAAAASPAAEAQVTKRALIIAIGDYPRPEVTGYRDLHAMNDVPLIRGALERHGFRDRNIRVLQDGDAKRQPILDELEGLVGRTRPGDYVVLHYSGHGHRVTDDSGDESDGYDEVLVPWGAYANPGPNYDGSQHIRDDQFGDFVRRLGERVIEGGASGQVLVTVDACFSGSITRSSLPVRGTPDPIGPPAMADWARSAGDAYRERLMAEGDLPDSVVLMTATRSGELDHEVRAPHGETVGPLSLALSTALADLGKGATFQLLYERVRAEMARFARFQTPTAEGALGAAVFGGTTSEPVLYHRVVRVDGRQAVIDGGVTSGIGAGTRVRFVRPSAGGYSEVGTGRVVQAGGFEAVLEVAGSSDVNGALAMVTELSGPAPRQSVFVSGAGQAFTAALRRQIESAEGGAMVSLAAGEDLADYRLVGIDGFVSAYPAARVPGSAALRLFRDTAEGGVEAARYLKASALGSYLGTVDLRHPSMAVDLAFLPARLSVFELDGQPECNAGDADTSDHTANREGGAWQVDAEQGYVLEVENRGASPAYLSILYLGADGSVEPLYPSVGAMDNFLPAGRRFRIPQCFQATGDPGTSMIKLFASESRLNLTDVLAGIEAGSSTMRSGEGGFAAALRDAAGTRMRSGDDAPGAGVTRTVLLVGGGS